jgi:hypothetical protein
LEVNLLFAHSLIKDGDEKAVQAMFTKGLIQNLNGVEIVRAGEFDEYGIVIIRVVGTVDFYYVADVCIVKSEAEEKAFQESEEVAERAREARFNQQPKLRAEQDAAKEKEASDDQ